MICTKCHERIVIDVVQPDVKYCKCSCQSSTSSNDDRTFLILLYQLSEINLSFVIFCVYLALHIPNLHVIFTCNEIQQTVGILTLSAKIC